ncbi:class I SAM-dependent methyltransferase [Terriglobus albidus]|uniref:Class I SAM-dependent methyltransferase n=1 Tax=Terriglobus albidus TaxID=1592106 RepID=A0A5B9E6M1_9BACT|nr:class I SAM-dependent methyltransferase [Terriglobus albidus]QEE27883.1 class I SAM-dependent methyltransferase [Terriglobus albidus]
MAANEKLSPEFDLYAASYDALLEDPIRNRFAHGTHYFHQRKWVLIQDLLHRAGLNTSSLRWLDVGCGKGELLELAGSHFAWAGGCDPSAAMLDSSTRFEVRQQQSQIELPFDTGSADFVTAVCVYHHVPQAARKLLMNEIKRVLSPGGLACIIEHNPWNPVTRAIVSRCPVDVDAELLTARDAKALMSGCGFAPLFSDYFLYLPERLYSRMASLESLLAKVPLGGQYALLARSPYRASLG